MSFNKKNRIKTMSSKKRKPTFVLVIPRFEDFFHSYYAGEIIRGVSLSASRLNADFLVHITDRSNHHGWLDSTLMDKDYIDGIIFADIDNDVGIVKKAIALYMSDLYLKNSKQFIDDELLKVNLSVVDEICELLHLKHNESSTIPEC